MVKNNVFFFSAIIISFLLYSRIVKVKDCSQYESLVPLEYVNSIEGKVVSNPVKASFGKSYYLCTVKINNVKGVIQNIPIESQGKGIVQVAIPSQILESVYPGKLYSRKTKEILIESGLCFLFCGKWNSEKKLFEVNDVNSFTQQKILPTIRGYCRLQLKRLLFSWSKAGGFVLALLTGSKEYLENDLSDSFRKSGLSFILALSGMHLSFFASMMEKTSTITLGKKNTFIPLLFGIIFFVWFAGFSPSLFRALLFTLSLTLLKKINIKNISIISILSIVFFMHIIMRREDIFKESFILSYSAITGLIIFTPLIEKFLVRFVPPYIANNLSASLSAQLVTLPITLCMFGYVAPIGVIATLIVSPLVSIFMALSVFSVIFTFILPFLSPLFNCIIGSLYVLIDFSVKLFANCPGITLE